MYLIRVRAVGCIFAAAPMHVSAAATPPVPAALNRTTFFSRDFCSIVLSIEIPKADGKGLAVKQARQTREFSV